VTERCYATHCCREVKLNACHEGIAIGLLAANGKSQKPFIFANIEGKKSVTGRIQIPFSVWGLNL